MKGMKNMTNFLPNLAEQSTGNNSMSMILMIVIYAAIFAALFLLNQT